MKKINMRIILVIIISVAIVGGFASTKIPESGRESTNPQIINSQDQQTTSMTNQGCVLTPLIVVEETPQQMEGPYFVDDVPERSDIRTDPDSDKPEQGIQLRLQIHVYDVDDDACISLDGAQVDIWHTNAYGLYSDVEQQNTIGEQFLRGYQMTDENGLVEFTTVYPSWYEGRAIHIHIKICTFEEGQKTSEWTSQFYMDDSINDEVHKQFPYSNHGLPPVKNNEDRIYAGPSTDGMLESNSGERLMLNVIQDGQGYLGTFNVGLDVHNTGK